jgi:hypothetical protein
LHQHDTPVASRKAAHDRRGVVARVVVDDDDGEARILLSDQAVETFADIAVFVARRHHHRHPHRISRRRGNLEGGEGVALADGADGENGDNGEHGDR